MEDGFKNTLFAFILIALFSTLILTSVVQMGSLHGKNDTEMVIGGFNYSGFNQTTHSVQETSENLRENFEKQNIFSSIAGIVVSGIFDIAKSMVLLMLVPFSLIGNILVNVLSIPQIVANVLGGLLILSIIFAIWALIKKGS